MAAIWMLFSWLTEKGILAMNPAREVKTERFSRTKGNFCSIFGIVASSLEERHGRTHIRCEVGKFSRNAHSLLQALTHYAARGQLAPPKYSNFIDTE
jgi:hypothetical protein